MVILYSPRCLDYAAAGHPENPERVRAAVAQLHKEFHTWVVPAPCTDEDILRVHTREQLEAVRSGKFDDADTPFFPDIFEIAKLSAGAAVLAAEHALAGRPAFSLMRPPGHHAERNRVMGFCYFNNIAIAVAKTLQSSPKIQRVAILDFDCHHGNGTEDIFCGNERVLFVSMHQSPCYPGTGLGADGNCVNYPLAPGTGPNGFWRHWMGRLFASAISIRNCSPCPPGSTRTRTTRSRTWDWRSRHFTRLAGAWPT